jgi:hypothetical protein
MRAAALLLLWKAPLLLLALAEFWLAAHNLLAGAASS